MKANPIDADSEDFRLKLLTQEIKFAKMLAGNEFNAAIKEKHINKLSTWLKNRASCSQAFSDKDCMRIWKGLFYSMWMSDKPLPQENLANKIASLLNSFNEIEPALQFYATFLKTMANEWNSIDQWRIDKFMMLVRKVTREMLRILQTAEWNDDAIDKLGAKLRETVLGTSHVPRGLFMHFTELFFEEVAKISDGDIEASSVTKLLQPFMFYVASQTDYKLIQFVVRHVFNYLLFQSEAGREYKEKFDSWKAMGFPGKSINELVLEEPEEEDEVENEGEDENGDSGDDENGTSSDNDGAEDENVNGNPLDPRAGRVDVIMSEIKFDPQEIVSQLEDLKYKKFTRVRNRKCIDRIVSTYKKYASGVFPIGIQKIKVDRDGIEIPDVEDKAVDFMEFEDELYGKQRELKKLAKRKRKRIVNDATLFDEFQAKSNKIAKIKQNANVWMEEDILPEPVVSKKARIEKEPSKDSVETKVTPKKPKSAKADSEAGNGKKRKSNDWEEPLQDGEIEYVIPSKKLQINGAKRLTITKDSITAFDVTPSKSSKAAKLPKTPEIETKTKIKSPTKLKDNPKESTSVQKTPTKNVDEVAISTPPNKNSKLQNGTPKSTEKKVKIASKLTKLNNSTPNTATFLEKTSQINTPNTKSTTIFSTPNSALMSAEKRVTISLKMNKSQEVAEYMRQLKQSPSLPYDSAKKPLKGALKPNLTPSPINPFYKRLIGMK